MTWKTVIILVADLLSVTIIVSPLKNQVFIALSEVEAMIPIFLLF